MTNPETETPMVPAAATAESTATPKSERKPKVKGGKKKAAAREKTTKTTTAKTAKAGRKTKEATTKPVLYTSETPKGLFPVGTHVRYEGGGRIKNSWLRKGMVGRVTGYRPGRKGGGLYLARFEGGATLLSVKRVAKVAKEGER